MRRTLVALGVVAASCPAWATTSPSEGSLAARLDDAEVPVPLEHTEVRIRITGHLADVEVEQRFRNPYHRKIEATYLFPLPVGAAVHDMEIDVGGRTLRGQILPVGAARATYRAAVRRGFVAALTTQERPNLFTQSVGNLEPGAVLTVRLRYAEPLVYADGGYELVFPMVAPPRHVPAGAKLSPAEIAAIQPPVLPPGQRPAHDLALTVWLDAATPVRDIGSPSHPLATDGGVIRLAAGTTIPNQDFVLRWRVAGEEPLFGVVAHRTSGDGSFLLYLQPPEVTTSPVPRELVFVVDTSSSMRGAPLVKARALVREALAALRPDDTFQIVRFDRTARPLGEALLASSPENRAGALAWLEALSAAGSTDVVAGLRGALGLPHDPQRLRIVVFLTDGYVGNEREVLAEVAAHLGEARLYSFGVGSAVNRYLLEEMAVLGRGAVQVVRPDEDTAVATRRFVRRIDTPVLTDVELDWGGLPVDRVTPARLPDLFAGQPLVVAGRYRHGARGTLVVRGRAGGRRFERAVEVTLPDRLDRPAVAQAWARARIAELERARITGDPTGILGHQITALALANRLLTAETAFVAVDTSKKTAGGEAELVPVPVDVPAGVHSTATGYGGMGLMGTAAGGGGMGYGTIGGGSYGTIGHGSSHAAAAPQVVIAAPQIIQPSPLVSLARGAIFGAMREME